MIQTIMQAILDNTISSCQLNGHYLYRIFGEEVTLYIGQAYNPVNRLQVHLGMSWQAKSRFGTLFEINRPLSSTWKLDYILCTIV